MLANISMVSSFLLAIFNCSSLDLLPKEYCTVGWADIGIIARVSLGFVVFLSKVGKMAYKFVSRSDSFSIGHSFLGLSVQVHYLTVEFCF
jgi:hypothetical protein